jgi:hypothetical protein
LANLTFTSGNILFALIGVKKLNIRRSRINKYLFLFSGLVLITSILEQLLINITIT